MADREESDLYFGHPGFDDEPSLPRARNLTACPTCDEPLARPSLSCGNCGRCLDDSPEGLLDPPRPS